MADFEIAYGETELREGGYVNDPVDRGGETHRGVARKFHPDWSGWKIIDQIKQDHQLDAGQFLPGNHATRSEPGRIRPRLAQPG
jgi:lysozyme family protein